MGYFWWHYKKRGMLSTWWAFFGPKLKREYMISFFYSVGFAIGCMIARTLLIPKHMLDCYSIDFRARP